MRKDIPKKHTQLRELKENEMLELLMNTPFFTAVYIVERLVLQTIYVLHKKILSLLGLKSVVYN